MSEEITQAENEEINSVPEENTEPKKAKLPKPEAPPIKFQLIYRLPNGEWDQFEEEEPTREDFYKMIEREFLKDGSLVTEIEYDEDGNELQKTLNVYNENGKITQQELFNEGMLAEKTVFIYDDKNRLLKETREFEEGFPIITHFSYDDQDRITEKRTDDNDGEMQKKETYQYHPVWKDKVIRHEIFDEENKLSTEEETEWEERNGEVKAARLIVKDHTFDTYRRTDFFDPSKREDGIAYATFNEKEKVIEYVKVIFDEDGLEAEEHSVSVNESDNFKVFYTYDEYSRPVVQEQHQADKIISKVHRRFNEQGSVSLIGYRSFSRGLYVDLFDYEYFD